MFHCVNVFQLNNEMNRILFVCTFFPRGMCYGLECYDSNRNCFALTMKERIRMSENWKSSTESIGFKIIIKCYSPSNKFRGSPFHCLWFVAVYNHDGNEAESQLFVFQWILSNYFFNVLQNIATILHVHSTWYSSLNLFILCSIIIIVQRFEKKIVRWSKSIEILLNVSRVLVLMQKELWWNICTCGICVMNKNSRDVCSAIQIGCYVII